MQITLPTGVWTIEWVEGILILDGQRVEIIVNRIDSRITIANHDDHKRIRILTALAVADAAAILADPAASKLVEIEFLPAAASDSDRSLAQGRNLN